MQAFSTISFSRYLNVRDFLTLQPALNTLFLVLIAPTITMILSSTISWLVVKTRMPGRQLLDTAAFLPHTTPSIVFAVSLSFLALIFREYVPIYGTITIILVAHVITFVSFGTRTLNGVLVQLHPELEEAARMAGASVLNTFRNITVPLVRHAVLNGWIWLALLSFREVTTAITLRTSEANSVLAAQIWGLWASGLVPEAAVLGVMIFFAMTGFVALARGIGGRVVDR